MFDVAMGDLELLGDPGLRDLQGWLSRRRDTLAAMIATTAGYA
jgi:hypothetical protein